MDFPPKDARVLLWRAQRYAAARAKGVPESDLRVEVDEVWGCLHFVSFFVDDGTIGSIDDDIFDTMVEKMWGDYFIFESRLNH